MDFDNHIPIYVQVVNDIKTRIIQGVLKPGDKLPSNRELAVEYAINANTAQRVYKELEDIALCFTKRGLGTFITEDAFIVSKLKHETAAAIMDAFMVKMKQLGYTKEEIIGMIEKESE